MIFDPPPKSRRRVVARFLWPTLLAVAVIIAAVVSAAGEETRTELLYLDEMRGQTRALARSGSMIEDVMSRISEIDREEFTTAMNGVSSDLDVALAFVAEEPPTDSLIPVWALYRQSVQSWATGVDGLRASILMAADDPEEVSVETTTADALGELRAGDNIFSRLQTEFDRDEIPDPASSLPEVTMTPTEGGLMTQSMAYVAAARTSTSGLGLRPGLRVSQVVSNPLWQINVESQAVVPATETISFSTVITNSGNVASEPESVTMTLAGGAEDVVSTAEVPALSPDGQTTIEFPEIEVLADTLYEVTVALELANPDSDMTDNEVAVQFTVNDG